MILKAGKWNPKFDDLKRVAENSYFLWSPLKKLYEVCTSLHAQGIVKEYEIIKNKLQSTIYDL